MAEEQPPKKIPRIRGQNFSSIEVNLISRRVVEELGLLRGKFGKDVTADAKNKMWEKITAKVNALGVSYRQVLTMPKTNSRMKKKERNRTGGGPAPKPISVAEENIINALKDTSSFKGIDDGMETSVGKYFWFTDVNNVLPFISNNKSDGFPQQTETSESTPTQFSIQESSSSDPIYFAEPVSSPIPAQIAVSGCQTSDEPPSSVESIWIRRLEEVHQRNKETRYTEDANLPVSAQIPPSCPNSSTQQPPKASENKRTKKPKKTAEDVYELQCLVLESDLKRNPTQMELFKKQMELYDMIKNWKIVEQSQC
ncbi:Hypothetical predicted protein [Mytilus galloprovincialis]|uniref:Myb/SANT-like DNA-binding domain-containing protein n=1 Tax=Mytilus galloprovincialis TaxID=29158 RepID=A0A8B6F4D8_MYTGA|nr:Hypothetical predicted protein [Mytilus galloprovincialis]